MTNAQETAMKTAYALLVEHFDSAVMIVSYDPEERDGVERELVDVVYVGGHATAIGLCIIAKRNLMTDEEEEEEDAL